MKRVGNRPAQLVRSASRRNKSANRFQFDITIDSITGLKPGSTHYVKWTRGVKVASTEHFETPKDVTATGGTPVSQKLSLLVTLYREEGKKFDAKEAKISVISVFPGKKAERTSAKARFDLAQYAGVPSATHPKTLKLSDRVAIRATIESRFLKSGSSGPGSGGASSALSSMDGVSMRSSDDEHDDFDDLALDDVPDPEVISVKSNLNSSSTVTSATTNSSVNSANSLPGATTTAKESKTGTRQKSSLSSSTVSSSTTNSIATVAQAPKSADVAASAPPPSAAKVSSSSRGLSTDKTDLVGGGNDKVVAEKERMISGLQAALRERERVAKELKEENSRLAARVLEAERQREAEDANLRRENDRLSASLKEAQRARSSATMSTKLHVESLMSRLDDRASQLEDAVSERDQAKKAIAEANEHRDEARLELEVARRELFVANEEVKQLSHLTAQRDEAIQTTEETRSELAIARRDLEEYRLRCKRLESVETRCSELSKEVDRLTVAAAENMQNGANGDRSLANQDFTAAQEEVQKRLAALQDEKESLTRKLRSHEAHQAKVKATYEELSAMYTQLRSDHTALQKEAVEARKMAREARVAAEAERSRKDDSDSLRQLVAELESGKENLQTDYDQVLSQIDTLQDRLDSTTQALASSQKEVEESQKEQEDLKRQRDIALQRALSRGKSHTPGPEIDQLRVDKEAAEQERDRLSQMVEQFRKDIGDLKDDLEYERTEKAKAREERDKIRENARALERRTSQAARTTDALHSLKRELSSHQMRAQDYENMVTELKKENESLRQQVNAQGGGSNRAVTRDEDMSQLLNELVEAKLAVAEAKGEKQQLEFEMHQMKKDERVMQQRLASKASHFEVRLESAKQEIERLRSYGGGGDLSSRRHSVATSRSNRNHDANEFNELGSDVDY